MSEYPKRLLPYFTGVSAGILAITFLGPEFNALAAKVILIVGIIGGLAFTRNLNAYYHKKFLENWDFHHSHGMIYFILSRFLVVRGTVAAIFFVLPAIVILKESATWNMNYSFFVLFPALLLIIKGHEEWKSCENEYRARTMRQLAVDSRSLSALNN